MKPQPRRPERRHPMPCPACRKIIDATDRLCPACGVDTDAKLARFRLVLTLIAMAVVCGVVAAVARFAGGQAWPASVALAAVVLVATLLRARK